MKTPLISLIIFNLLLCMVNSFAQEPTRDIVIKQATDFAVTGTGTNNEWEKADWNELHTHHADGRKTKFKTLYSATGIYFFFYNDDSKLTVTNKKDFDSLWTEDVTEVFLWPDTSAAVYLEYEISPRNRELVLLIPNMDRKVVGWIPWNYTGKRKVVHETSIVKDSDGNMKAWTAEFFIPFDLMRPLVTAPPAKGTVWKGNFYRVDYDDARTIEWSWKQTEKSFHEYRRFGRLLFE